MIVIQRVNFPLMHAEGYREMHGGFRGLVRRIMLIVIQQASEEDAHQ